MATNYTKIILKHSLVAGRVPSAADLTTGELALNVADGTLYALNALGQVVEVRPLNLRDGQVLTSKLADLAVTGEKVADKAISLSKLDDELQALVTRVVGSADLADGSVTTAKLANRAVTSEKLAGGAVTEQHLEANLRSFLMGTAGRYIGHFAGHPTGRDPAGMFVSGIVKGDFYFNTSEAAFFVAMGNASSGDAGQANWTRVGPKTIGTDLIDNGAVTLAKLADEVMAAVDGKVAAEAADRAAADAALSARIDNVLSNIDPAALDSLTEIVAAFQAADSDLEGTISQLAAASSSAVAAEKARAEAAEASLQSSIGMEGFARQEADANLQGAIDAEASARQAMDSALQDAISDLVTGANAEAQRSAAKDAEHDAAIAELVDALDAEEAARVAGDAAAQAAVVTEKAAREAADAALTAGLNSEAAARAAGDASLQAALAAEVARAKAVEGDVSSIVIDGTPVVATSLAGAIQELTDAVGNALGEAEQDYIARDAALRSALEAAIAQEGSARQIADTSLQTNLNTEVATRTSEIAAVRLELDAAVAALRTEKNGDIASINGSIASLASRVSALEVEINGGTF